MTSESSSPRRKRQSGVRGRILDMLADGPALAQDILDKGGFSPASLYLNLKALKNEGAVDTQRDGRAVRYFLTGQAPAAAEGSDEEGAAAPAPKKRGRKPGSGKKGKTAAAPKAPNDLRDALGVLTARLAPIDNVNEKLLVLGQLAGSLPGPVSKVLNSVIDDLSRLSGKR
ncbi:helix-turn-helix domain-containing protein [Nevskia sp.]|uniref:helix-turn-helix domain-containing protein n=1 Tax=Nevskia sp. TaxID=1929292 RepID=UPI0025DD0955|nr:helix-turn-helix domain-containing protein [Nevskia sp.]